MSFVVSAFVITVIVLGLYAAYLRSRLSGLRRRASSASTGSGDQSARNVSAAAPIATTAQPANSPSGSTRS
jgi:predicted Na+-dependent transporter